jgi:fibrillin 2/3
VCGNGVCSNTIGSFTCRCEEGYSAKLDSGPACTDEDECEMGTHRCDLNAACINHPVIIITIIQYLIIMVLGLSNK